MFYMERCACVCSSYFRLASDRNRIELEMSMTAPTHVCDGVKRIRLGAGLANERTQIRQLKERAFDSDIIMAYGNDGGRWPQCVGLDECVFY